jgi:rare lipoprotein A
VRLDTFEEYQYAAVQRARVAGLGPHITQVPDGRSMQFRVEIGPLDDVHQADAVLDRALAAGIPDACIVVE